MHIKNICLLLIAASLPAIVWAEEPAKGEKKETAVSANLKDAESAWVLDVLLGEDGALKKINAAQPPTISFAPDGSVFGFSGVNQFRGTYTAENGSLHLSALAMTRRFALAEELNKLETMYTALIGRTRRYTIERDVLKLMALDGTVLLVFSHAAPPARTGSANAAGAWKPVP
ncbi:MAG: META domain-containing protein [Spirochaetaceae bacterium]|jgi:heat shock protein HslJ|nr:META domain-containing protein [Spirochaetaceae bacterium]